MENLLNSIYILLFSLILSSIIHSEIVENQQWTNIEISKNISQNIEVSSSQEIRYKSNYTEFNKTFTALSLSFKLNPIIKFTGQYRYTVYNDKEKKRIAFNTKLNKKTFNFGYSYKLKIQREYEKDEIPKNLIRNKFAINYPINSIYTPFISYELFQFIEDDNLIREKFRASTGIEIDILSNQSVEIFYTYNGKYKDFELEKSNIFGIGYKYSF
jgi:hypothetical protein